MNRKNYFLLNPAAGQGTAVKLKEKLLDISQNTSHKLDIYFTREELDAEVIARNLAKESSKENPIRIYACGGDGTLNEVVNGVIGFENVEVGIIPTGTGNDFIRNFGSMNDFLDIEKQLNAKSQKVDVVGYKIYKNDYEINRVGVNMFNIGFDSKVVEHSVNMKKLPLVSGHLAYGLGTVVSLLEKKTSYFKLTDENGNRIYDGKSLLIAIGKGCYCGGGIKALTKADTSDGKIDISLIKDCKRRDIIKLFNKYKKGTHLESKIGKELFVYAKVNKFTLESNEEMLISIDGELDRAIKVEFNINKQALSFVNPNL